MQLSEDANYNISSYIHSMNDLRNFAQTSKAAYAGAKQAENQHHLLIPPLPGPIIDVHDYQFNGIPVFFVLYKNNDRYCINLYHCDNTSHFTFELTNTHKLKQVRLCKISSGYIFIEKNEVAYILYYIKHMPYEKNNFSLVEKYTINEQRAYDLLLCSFISNTNEHLVIYLKNSTHPLMHIKINPATNKLTRLQQRLATHEYQLTYKLTSESPIDISTLPKFLYYNFQTQKIFLTCLGQNYTVDIKASEPYILARFYTHSLHIDAKKNIFLILKFISVGRSPNQELCNLELFKVYKLENSIATYWVDLINPAGAFCFFSRNYSEYHSECKVIYQHGRPWLLYIKYFETLEKRARPLIEVYDFKSIMGFDAINAETNRKINPLDWKDPYENDDYKVAMKDFSARSSDNNGNILFYSPLYQCYLSFKIKTDNILINNGISCETRKCAKATRGYIEPIPKPCIVNGKIASVNGKNLLRIHHSIIADKFIVQPQYSFDETEPQIVEFYGPPIVLAYKLTERPSEKSKRTILIGKSAYATLPYVNQHTQRLDLYHFSIECNEARYCRPNAKVLTYPINLDHHVEKIIGIACAKHDQSHAIYILKYDNVTDQLILCCSQDKSTPKIFSNQPCSNQVIQMTSLYCSKLDRLHIAITYIENQKQTVIIKFVSINHVFNRTPQHPTPVLDEWHYAPKVTNNLTSLALREIDNQLFLHYTTSNHQLITRAVTCDKKCQPIENLTPINNIVFVGNKGPIMCVIQAKPLSKSRTLLNYHANCRLINCRLMSDHKTLEKVESFLFQRSKHKNHIDFMPKSTKGHIKLYAYSLIQNRDDKSFRYSVSPNHTTW